MLVQYTLTNHKQTCYQSSQLALGCVCFPALGTGCMRFFLFVNAQGDYFDSQNKTTFTEIIRTCDRTYKLANLQADQSLGYRTDSDNQTEKIHTHNNLQHELTYFAIANPLFSMKPYKLSCLAWNLDHDCRLANAGVLGRSILKSYIDK